MLMPMSENVRKIDRPILPVNHMEHLDEVEPEKVSDDFFIKIKSVNTSKQFTKIQFSENSDKNIFLEKDSFSANHSLDHSYEKNKNISEEDLERTTNVISLRIPSKHYILYRKMSYRQKYLLKLGLISLIESLSGVSQNGPVFINMNIDMNMLMNKIDNSENIEVLKEKLDLYRDRLKICNEKVKMMKELEKEIEKLKLLENEAKRALDLYRQRKITSETALEIVRRALEKR